MGHGGMLWGSQGTRVSVRALGFEWPHGGGEVYRSESGGGKLSSQAIKLESEVFSVVYTTGHFYEARPSPF